MKDLQRQSDLIHEALVDRFAFQKSHFINGRDGGWIVTMSRVVNDVMIVKEFFPDGSVISTSKKITWQ